MRWTPSGDLYIADQDGLEKVSPNGARTVVLSGVRTSTASRWIAGAGLRQRRRDPDLPLRSAGRPVRQSLEGVIERPNGLDLQPGVRHVVREQLGRPRDPHPSSNSHRRRRNRRQGRGVGDQRGTGTFDGMAADECGNIYVANSDGAGEILRFTPDGKRHSVVIKRRARPCTTSCGAAARDGPRPSSTSCRWERGCSRRRWEFAARGTGDPRLDRHADLGW